ncbi:hypothetical protein [Ralstonia pseudosolanacearum]|uniref:hypothetical protein n=1 Tax=Ralstonia pseudosolanacearum TaxID=1310165 RepID=UPI000B084E9B|nr:hypothetical protein [Ralstonia pseudosolanacearum]ARU24894.1 Methyl-accepting chemotaxis protein I (serine chemoreceptor protein) [Ralstonia solanacearum]QWF64273.1 hypothetical protein KM864_21800 [Ralstonia solanacearum]UYR04609.1 hypothetical protein NQS37_18270 [Ralstonia pseudosolanacearum]UYR13966.1 hypothetical protein NQS35_23480 [Ralstonia pseudosolanacearum]
MAKATGTVTVKRSRNGTTIRATGSAAQVLFDALVKQVEQAAGGLPAPPECRATINTDSQPAAEQQQNTKEAP